MVVKLFYLILRLKVIAREVLKSLIKKNRKNSFHGQYTKSSSNTLRIDGD